MANKRQTPTVKELVYSIISVIHRHPLIQNPIVTHPIPNADGKLEPVHVQRYRSYDGLELIEPGLTIAVFPHFRSHTASSAYNKTESQASVVFDDYEMGFKNSRYQYSAEYTFIIALYYQEVAINEIKDQVYYTDRLNRVTTVGKEPLQQRGSVLIKPSEFQVEINPAEDILRDYLDVLRLVLEESTAKGMFPWRTRGSQVRSFDFPTTSWSKESADIYFHKAFLTWELSMYVPCTSETVGEVETISVLLSI